MGRRVNEQVGGGQTGQVVNSVQTTYPAQEREVSEGSPAKLQQVPHAANEDRHANGAVGGKKGKQEN